MEVAGVYPRTAETATQDECEDDDMGASTKRTTTEEQADAEIKRKGQADRRRIPVQDYGSTACWAITRPAPAIANTTSASAEPPPAKLPSLEDQEGRFLFPWQRLRAGRRFLLQLFVITLGATGSVVLATLVTPSRGIKGINDPELQAVFSSSPLLRPAVRATRSLPFWSWSSHCCSRAQDRRSCCTAPAPRCASCRSTYAGLFIAHYGCKKSMSYQLEVWNCHTRQALTHSVPDASLFALSIWLM